MQGPNSNNRKKLTERQVVSKLLDMGNFLTSSQVILCLGTRLWEQCCRKLRSKSLTLLGMFQNDIKRVCSHWSLVFPSLFFLTLTLFRLFPVHTYILYKAFIVLFLGGPHPVMFRAPPRVLGWSHFWPCTRQAPYTLHYVSGIRLYV